MKQFVKFATTGIMALAAIISCSQLALAADTKPYYSFVKKNAPESAFSIELNQQGTNQVIILSIKNPGKKNLSVTLNGPGGLLDNFYTGKKLDQLDRAYNFTSAETGVYILEISDGDQRIKKQIKLESINVQPVKLSVQ